jgi:hypothetical protein
MGIRHHIDAADMAPGSNMLQRLQHLTLPLCVERFT